MQQCTSDKLIILLMEWKYISNIQTTDLYSYKNTTHKQPRLVLNPLEGRELDPGATLAPRIYRTFDEASS